MTRTTCDELARIWPDKYPRPDAETTAQNRRMIKRFGKDFAYRDPEGISAEEMREWALNNLHLARFVRSMFNDFAADGLLPRGHVWVGMKLPRSETATVVPPTLEQIEKLASHARETERVWLAGMLEFSAAVGLRFAEQQAVLVPGAGGLGNYFCDTVGQRIAPPVDPARRMQIDWQRGRDGRLKAPKTKRGVRRVLIPQRAQAAVAETLSAHEHKSAFLWPLCKDAHRRNWSDLRRECGVWFKWHNLRHFCATWMLDHGATVDDVAVQLGIRPEQVRDTYGHPDEEKALGRLESLVSA